MPRIAYAAEVWYTPVAPSTENPRVRTGSVRIAQKLGSIQRRALVTLSGALRSTATNILEVHSNILPMHLALNRACCRSAIRLATLPPSHPLSKPVNRAAKRYVKSHRSPLHELFHYTQISPSTMEKILPTRRRPNFTPAFSTSIADSRHEAIEEAKKLHTTRQVRIYSDGSLYEGGVGASAVLYLGNRFQKSLTYHLGPEHHHTVYEAEIVGLLLGTHLLSSLSRRLHNPIICVDNQPSI